MTSASGTSDHEPGADVNSELSRLNVDLELRVRERTAELAAVNASLVQERASRERVEAELRLAHRLEAVGQLAAGVAHEINTPIQYIGDSVHFLQTAFDDLLPLIRCAESLPARLRAAGQSTVADELERALDAADAAFVVAQIPTAITRTLDGIERVAAIVRAMKAFAHPGSETKAPADLNEALATTIVVCRNEYKYVADVETDFGALPSVPCQLGELNQVFLNLLVNAAHAVGDQFASSGSRGVIRVATSHDDVMAVIRISDTGAGIPCDIREKLFDPFFTTKPVGKGTGQGLTLARSIVVKHGGTLTFTSEVGQGTMFEIRLPLVSDKREASEANDANEAAA